MKKATVVLLCLCFLFLFVLSGCGQRPVIEMPYTENTATPQVVAEEPEELPEVVQASLDYQLGVGTAMKWFDDGYLVFVPQGEVTLGDSEYENNPVHEVDIDDFWIYMFKVTNGQYRHCVLTGACTPPASEDPYPVLEDPTIKDEPVVGVTWDQADAYCKWMNGRLPTKNEWEKAARGSQAWTYPWGNEDPDCDLLNYGDCEDPAISKVYEYSEGRSYYQAFDMAGNAYEWVFDLYEDDFISQLPGEPPAGPPEGTERSVRGSSYMSDEELIPSAHLFYLEPEKYRPDLGFRCVLGEAHPPAFAHPCIKTAWIPGVPPPGVPGPTPDDNELPDFGEGKCETEIGASVTQYCSNLALQHGGLDLTIVALPGYNDLYVKSWSGDPNTACLEGTDPLKCFGPEMTSIKFEICATCTPALKLQPFSFYCDSLYEVTDTFPHECIYNGAPPAPGQPCPNGFAYDQVNDICVELGTPSKECPKGYLYNQDTDCCEATYAPPAEDPDTPSSSYLICPPGAGNVTFIGEGTVQGEEYVICYYHIASPEKEDCIERTFYLGECREIPNKCNNPSQYTAKNPCENNGCKWENVFAGAPTWKCVYP